MSMNNEQRSGFKWTVNECLRLEREYDLLKLSVEEIALLHQRSPYAIMFKLDEEGIADFNELYQQTYPNEASKDEASEAEAEDQDDDYEEYDIESEDEESEAEEESDEESESDDEKYDRYNMKQQVKILTKQLANLTAVVYKIVSGKSTSSSKHRSAF